MNIIKLKTFNLLMYFCITTFVCNYVFGKEQRDYSNLIYSKKEHSIWLPITYSITGTMDVIQNPYWFSQHNYSEKVKEVWNRIKDPHNNIKKDGGYNKFFKDEFLSSRVLPNIGLHFLGGAYDTRWLTEYYSHYNYPTPKLFAFLTTYIAHLGNEALETTSDEISSHDHIADLYFFDLAAFFAASYDPFMRYLVDDLGMKAWHFNPMYDIDSGDFFNSGLNYIFRPKKLYFANNKIKPLYFLGMQTLAGASYNYTSDEQVTMAAGISLTNPLEQKGRFVTMLAHEKMNTLEASLFINGSEDFRWRLNLYEKILERFDYFKNKTSVYNFGLTIGQTKGPAYAVGLNVSLPFGLGFIKNTRNKRFFE